MACARVLQRRAGAGVPRDPARRAGPRGRAPRCGSQELPRQYRASRRSIGDPADIEKLADLLVKAERPCGLLGTQVWTCRAHEQAIDWSASSTSRSTSTARLAGLLPPGDPASFRPHPRADAFDNADVILIVGTPFDFRMGYGRRLGQDADGRADGQDYRTVGKNRDIDARAWSATRGTIVNAVVRGGSAPRDNGAQSASRWLEKLREDEAQGAEKLMPLFTSETLPIHPVPRGMEINEFLTEDTVYIGDGGDVVTISRPGRAAPHTRALDGSRRPRHARRRHGFRDRVEARAAEEGGGLLLRRRLLRHDGVRHRRRPTGASRAVYRA